MYVIGTTILVWGSFQDYQTNIWVPQTYKDPRIQTDFQAWCTATAKLVDRHRLLQESPDYEPYRKQSTTSTTASLEEQIMMMPYAERVAFFARMQEKQKESTTAVDKPVTSSPAASQQTAVLGLVH